MKEFSLQRRAVGLKSVWIGNRVVILRGNQKVNIALPNDANVISSRELSVSKTILPVPSLQEFIVEETANAVKFSPVPKNIIEEKVEVPEVVGTGDGFATREKRKYTKNSKDL